jgi:hypothetical protein
MQWPRPGPEHERRRLQAEQLIEASGDGRAIRMLGPLRRDPQGWGRTLLRNVAASPVLKIALGVFLGVLAADAVRALLQSGALDSLVDTVDAALREAGGLEALEALAAQGAATAGLNSAEPSPGAAVAAGWAEEASDSEVADGETEEADWLEDLTGDLDVPL